MDIRLVEERYKSRIKLLGVADHTPRGWVFRVHPTVIPRTHPFANVRNEYNAISLHGNAVGEIMLYGKGAGQMATSSAVLSDLIFLCRQIANGTAGLLPYVSSGHEKKIRLGKMADIQCRYYLRVNTLDRPGLLSRITGILGRQGISLDSVHQDSYEKSSRRKGVPIIFVTHKTRESNIQASVHAINQMPTTLFKTVLLRME